ncbi:ribosome small subunit-dependent GTPase A [soil metagenome]
MHESQLGAPQALPLSLIQLGFNDEFASAFAQVARPSERPARVVAVHRNRVIVASADGEYSVPLDRALLRTDSINRPSTGDWTVVRVDASGQPVEVRAVVPRRTAFIRGAAGAKAAPQVVAANIDYVLIVSALPDDLNERRLERYVALAWESGAMPMVVLTKCDLVDNVGGYVAMVRGVAPGVDVIAVSAANEDGIVELRARLAPYTTIALLGSSGVGKSTLVNRLAGATIMRTADVDRDGRGRHTTTHRELVRLPGGLLVIDTPGMRELQLWSADAGLEQVFDDIMQLSQCCRFADCGHDVEPGCAVTGAVANGQLSRERLASWRKLIREAARARMRGDALVANTERAKLRAMMRAIRVQAKRRDD